MSRYITNTNHNGIEVEISIGFDINGKYFFDVFDKKEDKLLDGSVFSKYSLADVKNKAKVYGIKIPVIDKNNFRLIKSFDYRTGIITK